MTIDMGAIAENSKISVPVELQRWTLNPDLDRYLRQRARSQPVDH